MRLLNTHTKTLEEFFENDVMGYVPYAILSHTWGGEEITFEQIQSSDHQAIASKAGYKKIMQTCDQAAKEGFKYVWIDTCCINKTKNDELSEAINSMFRWYKNATKCFVYLSDVYSPENPDQTLQSSRWFTRGWTLQELIAPPVVTFFTYGWELIGSRSSLATTIFSITGIDMDLLTASPDCFDRMQKPSIAQRMSWASKRQTTRVEDMAYCLMGILDVSMPTLYGEGERAFIRLQEEIIQRSDDESIFAWNPPSREWVARHRGRISFLAPSPAAFAASGNIGCIDPETTTLSPFSLTNRGISIDIRVHPVGITDPLAEMCDEIAEYPTRPNGFAILNCRRMGDMTNMLAIPLIRGSGKQYRRSPAPYMWLNYEIWQSTPISSVFLMTNPTKERLSIPSGSFIIENLPEDLVVCQVSPEYTFHPAEGLITKPIPYYPNTGHMSFICRDLIKEDCLEIHLKPKEGSEYISKFDQITIRIGARRFSRTQPVHWVSYDVEYNLKSGKMKKLGVDLADPSIKVDIRDIVGRRVVVVKFVTTQTMSQRLVQLVDQRVCRFISRNLLDSMRGILKYAFINPTTVFPLRYHTAIAGAVLVDAAVRLFLFRRTGQVISSYGSQGLRMVVIFHSIIYCNLGWINRASIAWIDAQITFITPRLMFAGFLELLVPYSQPMTRFLSFLGATHLIFPS